MQLREYYIFFYDKHAVLIAYPVVKVKQNRVPTFVSSFLGTPIRSGKITLCRAYNLSENFLCIFHPWELRQPYISQREGKRREKS